jgi:Asp/Glu/Hydantoin racemase
MLGILTLDTAFPRIPGDLGSPDTFAFPVRHRVVRGANVDEIVHGRDGRWLMPFVEAARELAFAGCTGITTTCGFLVRWQAALARGSPVPVLTSSLLQLPLVQATLAAGKRVGIVTYSANDLDEDALRAASAPPDTPVVGVDEQSYFARTIRLGAATLDRKRMEDDTVAAARRLVAAHADVGAIVLECANMPPYRAAVAEATRVPVFDAANLVAWFHAALGGAPIADAWGRRSE